MKFSYLIPALLAFTLSLSAQAATLTKISKVNYGELESFLNVSLAAQKVAYNDFRMEVVFETEAFKVSALQSHSALEPVKAALAQLGYGDAKVAELSDIDDQIDDTISAAFLLNLEGVPAAAKAKMEKLEQEGSKSFSYGDTRIRVFSATSMDANHYDINAIVIYDVQSQEVVAVASQQSE
jgi:hypothetical protein